MLKNSHCVLSAWLCKHAALNSKDTDRLSLVHKVTERWRPDGNEMYMSQISTKSGTHAPTQGDKSQLANNCRCAIIRQSYNHQQHIIA